MRMGQHIMLSQIFRFEKTLLAIFTDIRTSRGMLIICLLCLYLHREDYFTQIPSGKDSSCAWSLAFDNDTLLMSWANSEGDSNLPAWHLQSWVSGNLCARQNLVWHLEHIVELDAYSFLPQPFTGHLGVFDFFTCVHSFTKWFLNCASKSLEQSILISLLQEGQVSEVIRLLPALEQLWET